MIWTSIYVASVVGVNLIFGVVPWLGSFIVGGIFILRDLAQREIGHRVLLASLAGIGITFLLADPFVAQASALAFAVSELMDWAIFTVTKRPFRERVLASSAVAAPVDTALFLGWMGFLSPAAFVIQVVSKLAAAVAIRWWPRRTLEIAP